MNTGSRRICIVVLAGFVLILGLSACASTPEDSALPVVTVRLTQSRTLATETPPLPATGAPIPLLPTPTSLPPAATTPAPAALPPEPQPVEFHAADGQLLQGAYYPSAVNPAPLVVLMHWAGGDQDDWVEIAYWLQNRGLGGRSPNPGGSSWLDPSWFPPMSAGTSYAVFTFSFRGCDGGCQGFEREKWLLDAQAAMLKASELDGVDPLRLAALGASIGADGAADGCLYLNSQRPNFCLGALSLSPGDYLTVLYADAVSTLGAESPFKPAWCLFAQADAPSAAVCNAAQGENYTRFEFPGDAHGMMLISPEIEPNPLELILDFLAQVLG